MGEMERKAILSRREEASGVVSDRANGTSFLGLTIGETA
jgi:hypothetical protein